MTQKTKFLPEQEEKRFDGFGVCELANIDPEQNRKRYYSISVQPGLFDLIVERHWGRLGSRLRTKEEFVSSLDEALCGANRVFRGKIRKGYRDFKGVVDPREIFSMRSTKDDKP